MIEQPPRIDPFREVLARLLLTIALKEPDPAERAAKLAILKKDGWL